MRRRRWRVPGPLERPCIRTREMSGRHDPSAHNLLARASVAPRVLFCLSSARPIANRSAPSPVNPQLRSPRLALRAPRRYRCRTTLIEERLPSRRAMDSTTRGEVSCRGRSRARWGAAWWGGAGEHLVRIPTHAAGVWGWVQVWVVGRWGRASQ